MTGISTLSGSPGPYAWSMQPIGVNNKGLDIRPRVPEGLDGFDQEVRKTISSVIKRGSIQFNLKISLSDGLNDRKIDLERLDNILSNVAAISKVAEEKGLVISPISLTDISVQHGFIDLEGSEEHKVSVTKAIIAHLPRLIEDFQKARSAEGKTLQKVLQSGVIKMERHLTACSAAIAKRPLEFKVSFEKAIQIEPNYADAFFNLGNIHKELRNYQKAVNYFQKTISINTKYVGAYNSLETLFILVGFESKSFLTSISACGSLFFKPCLYILSPIKFPLYGLLSPTFSFCNLS